MVQVPLPQTPLSPGGNGVFEAPAVAVPNPAGTAQRFAEQGRGMFNAALERIAENNERKGVAEFKEAQARAEEEITQATREYLNLVGKAVGDSRESSWNALQEKLAAIQASLPRPSQRDLFGQVVMRNRLNTVVQRWNDHEDRALRAREIGTTSALFERKAETAVDDIAAQRKGEAGAPAPQPETPAGAGEVRPGEAGPGAQPEARVGGPVVPGKPLPPLDSAIAEAEALGRLQGMDGPELESFVRKLMSPVHELAVERLLNENAVDAAMEHLEFLRTDEGQKQIDPEALSKLTRTVKGKFDDETAARFVDQIYTDMVAERNQGAPDTGGLENLPEDKIQELRDWGMNVTDEQAAAMSGQEDDPDYRPPPPVQSAEFRDHAHGIIYDKWRRSAAPGPGHERDRGEITTTVRNAMLSEVKRRVGEMEKRETDLRNRLRRQGEQYLVDGRGYLTVDTLRRDNPKLWRDLYENYLLDDLSRFNAQSGNYPTDYALLKRIEGGDPELMSKPWENLAPILETGLNAVHFEIAKMKYAEFHQIAEGEFATAANAADDIKVAAIWAGLVDPKTRKVKDLEMYRRFEIAIVRRWREKGYLKGNEWADERLAEAKAMVEEVVRLGTGEKVPIYALTHEQTTGGPEAERRRAMAAGEPIETEGAEFMREDLAELYSKRLPGETIPPALTSGGPPIKVGSIPKTWRRNAREVLRAKERPTEEWMVAVVWAQLTPAAQEKARAKERAAAQESNHPPSMLVTEEQIRSFVPHSLEERIQTQWSSADAPWQWGDPEPSREAEPKANVIRILQERRRRQTVPPPPGGLR